MAGAVPVDNVPKKQWREFYNEARAGLEAWLEDKPPDSEIARRLHADLGKLSVSSHSIR